MWSVYAIIQQELLLAHARISVHHGKTQVWNRGGVEPQDIDILTAEARARVPGAVVWRGAQELPATKQGLNVFGAPNWAPTECARVLEAKVRGTTSSLPAHSTRERPTGKLVVVVDVRVHPSKFLAEDGASRVDIAIRGVARQERVVMFCRLSWMSGERLQKHKQQLASLPLILGGLGLASAERTRHAAHWASWADCLAMVNRGTRTVAEEMVVGLDRDPAPCWLRSGTAGQVLAEANVHPPGWRDLAVVVPEPAEEAEPKPAQVRLATVRVTNLETKHLNERVWPGGCRESAPKVSTQSACLRSSHRSPTPQGWTANPSAFCCSRRLRLPLPLSSRTCRCGRQLDPRVGGVSPSKLPLRR